MGAKTKPAYPEEFRQQLVERYASGRRIAPPGREPADERRRDRVHPDAALRPFGRALSIGWASLHRCPAVATHFNAWSRRPPQS